MNWREKANEFCKTLEQYRNDNEGWKQVKKTKEVTVWTKPSPDFNGALYKAEGIVNSDVETVFHYIEPSVDGPRSKWDKAVKELQMVQSIDQDLHIVRTITHSAFGGLISSRDFIDLVLTIKNDDFISTNAQNVEHSDFPVNKDPVRGKNWPCGIICYRIPDEPKKTKVVSILQSDLGGMLPKSLVENAMPSNILDFFTELRRVLKADGHWSGQDVDS